MTVLIGVTTNGAVLAQEGTVEPVRVGVVSSLNSARSIAKPVAVTSTPRPVDLVIDFAVILKIAGDVSAIVLGNSDIADANVVANDTIALTGKSVGTTNIIVLGPEGGVLSEFEVQVAANKPGTVTVRRALSASSYACNGSSCKMTTPGADGAPTQ